MTRPAGTKASPLSTLIVLAVLASVGYGLFWVMSAEPLPSKMVTGTVESFGMAASYTGNSPMARVRMKDGSTRDVPIDANIQKGCSVGDKIGLVQTGINVEVAPGGCNATSITQTKN